MEASAQTNAYLRAHLDQLNQRIEEARDRLQTAQDRAAQTRGQASNPDATINATVDARGRLIALDLDPRVCRRLSSAELAEQIVAVAGRAADDATRQTTETMAGFLPAGASMERVLAGENPFAGLGFLFGTEVSPDDAVERWLARMTGAEPGGAP